MDHGPHPTLAYRLCCQARIAEREGKLATAAALYTSAAAHFGLAGKRDQQGQCHTHRSRCLYDAARVARPVDRVYISDAARAIRDGA